MKKLNYAFTMAEILLSLTIIGVVAAITLPSLTGNINERTWNTQRKALYARFSQAIALMPALNGYGTFTEDESGSIVQDNVAETFVTAGLSKVLKINNICSYDKLNDCGIASTIITPSGNKITDITTMEKLNSQLTGSFTSNHSGKNTHAAAFETENGESIIVHYNPQCTGNLDEKPFTANGSYSGNMDIRHRICVNFIYDLNGNKGPNTVGKDIGFMTALYPFDAKLFAPYPAIKPLDSRYPYTSSNGISASKACTEMDSEYRLPQADELVSMFVNKRLIDADTLAAGTYAFVSSDLWLTSSRKAYVTQSVISGTRDDEPRESAFPVWCVKR